jgi:hypothetical protein
VSGSSKKVHVLDVGAKTEAHDLTPAVWTSWCEAAAVTFDRVHHPEAPPRAGRIIPSGKPPIDCVVAWPSPDERVKRSHANDTDATEAGAYAVATLAMHAVDGWQVVARTQTESGADVWMEKPNDVPDSQVRLEVSGMAQGADESAQKALRGRLATKIAQLKKGKSPEPGIAAVVGFELVGILSSELTSK